ncbi:MAG: hypothetical protein V4655_10760 [Bdellovibrionota bacterium]
MDTKRINSFEHLKLAQRFNVKLLSGFNPLDTLLDGGLQEGEVSEWGMPWGQGLRDLVLPFLSCAQRQHGYWILWVSGHDRVTINPWAWHARSIDLETIRFVSSQDPLYDLRQLFLSDFFRVIVLDQIPHLKEEDCQHLARHARTYGLTILILRPHRLTHEQGNIWTRLRANCFQDLAREKITIEILKGRAPKTLTFSPNEFALFRGEPWAF